MLGASNVTRGLSTIIETLRLRLGSPLEILAAIGHGRSYGSRSTVFVRSLPSILECGLWEALAGSVAARPEVPTFVLIADVGNDIMYGAQPRTIAGWVEQCIERFEAHPPPHRARIAMTMLPMERIAVVKPWHFELVKMFLFPTRNISYERAMTRARELHEQLVDLAQRRGVRPIDCRAPWYGVDPIHIRRVHFPAAWGEILCSCLNVEGNGALTPPRASLLRWMQVRSAAPQRWWMLGIGFHQRQPARVLADGTSLGMF